SGLAGRSITFVVASLRHWSKLALTDGSTCPTYRLSAVVETSLMFFAPAATPDSVIDRLTRATQENLQQRDIQAKMLDAGMRLEYEGPEDLHARIIREIPIWKEIAKRPGVKKR